MTRLVFLGTGTPNPDPQRQGPALAIVAGGQSYIVDCGVGIVRQAMAAAEQGVPELEIDKLKRAFITHLHSDHTLGLPDLILTPAVTGRDCGMDVFGPPGTKRMVEQILDAWSEDVILRLGGGEPSIPEAYRVAVREIREGDSFADENVKVFPFTVNHGAWKHALGYRFEILDKVIVLSGDTVASENLVKFAQGCDILVHEAYSRAGLSRRPRDWRSYHSRYHTSGIDLGRLADRIQPKQLLLNHLLPFGEEPDQVLQEVKENFHGEARIAEDLEVVDI